MRPTWHFVTPADIRWMLALTAPRVHQASAFYYRQHGLDAKTLSRAHRVLVVGAGRRTLPHAHRAGRRAREARHRGARSAPGAADDPRRARAGDVQRPGARQAAHLRAVRRARAPPRRGTPRDPGAELASRYFAQPRAGHAARLRLVVRAHGGAGAGAAIESASPALESRELDGFTYLGVELGARLRRACRAATFLLPNYDEYLIAYKDRHLVRPPAGVDADGIMKGADAFAHPLVVDGLLAGVWRRRVSGAQTASRSCRSAAHHAPAPRGEGRRRASRHVFRAGAIDGRAGLKAGPHERMLALTDRTALSAVLPA